MNNNNQGQGGQGQPPLRPGQGGGGGGGDPNPGPNPAGGGNAPINMPFMMGGGQGDDGDIRNEKLCKTQASFLCPTFRVPSFTFAIMIVTFMFMFCSLVYPGGQDHTKFLTPTANVNFLFGSKLDPYIKQEQEIYRWLTALLVSASFQEMLMNMLQVCIFGFNVEDQFGTKLTALIYLGGGVGGNIFSSVVAPSTECEVSGHVSSCCGAAPSVMAIQAAFLAMVFINWHNLDGQLKTCQMCIGFMFVFFQLMSQMGTQMIYGQLGALMSTFAICMAIKSSEQAPQWQVNAKQFAMVFIAFWFIGLPLIYFTTHGNVPKEFVYTK